MRLMANDGKTLSDSYFAAFFDDDEGDEEYVPMEEWKQVYIRRLLCIYT